MTDTDTDDTEDWEEAYDHSDDDGEEIDERYTIVVNGTEYAFSKEFRQLIQSRAEYEYEGNHQFSCWWKIEDGNPILVIETAGPMAPWDKLDQLGFEDNTQAVTTDGSQSDDRETEDVDSGSGMRSVPRDEVVDDGDDSSDLKERAHFGLTDQSYEELPSPDGEEADRIPPKPKEVDEGGQLVFWIPENPELDEVWGAGEAIVETQSWVEWDIQAKADDSRPNQDKENSHDHFESLLQSTGCKPVGEVEDDESDEKQPDDIGGKYGGDNWNI